MADLFQDVVSLVCMSTFLVSMAMWIGALVANLVPDSRNDVFAAVSSHAPSFDLGRRAVKPFFWPQG